jgi:thiol-disulfide isomerase/thioredoxin
MSLFYEQPPTINMINNLKTLPGNIGTMIALLEKHQVPPEPVPLKKTIKNKSGIDITHKEFKGNNIPVAIKLQDINGNTLTKDDFTGKITLINFWATWCAPCIEEIPSLNRLKNKMAGLPFELISINYAENKKTIKDFMKEVNVEFPVLLDHNGDFAKKFNVIVYPSTFVIDT